MRLFRLSLLVLLVFGLLPISAVLAQPFTVEFEVVNVTPTGATVRATVHGAFTGPADLMVLDLADARSKPAVIARRKTLSSINVDRVETSTVQQSVPIMGKRATTVADLKSVLDIDSEGTALSADLAGLADSTKLSDIRKSLEGKLKNKELASLNRLSDTVDDVVAYETKDVVKDTRTRVTGAVAASTLSLAPIADSVLEFQITTGLEQTASGWGTSGVLALRIGGNYYYDMTNSSWWNTSWSKRTKLTFDNTASAAALTDFPVLIKLVEPTIEYDDFQADGGDIRFIDTDGTTSLDYEIETWDTAGTSYIWVEIPSLAATNTDYVTMYWGNAGVANGWNVNGTWNSGYVGVWHMNDGADTSHINDSTSNGNTGTKTGAATPPETSGLVGRAQLTTGDQIVSTMTGWSNAALSIEVLVNYDNDTTHGNQRLVSSIFGNISLYTDWQTDTTGQGYWRINTTDTDWQGYGTDWYNITDWTMRSMTYDGANSVGYKDAASVISSGLTGTVSHVPNYFGGGNNVTLDEIRVSSTARSADWIEATYLTMTSAGFTTFGSAGTLAVTTNAASAVADFSATLNGDITDIGNAVVTRRGFEWDTNTGAPYANEVHTDGTYNTGAYTYPLAGLTGNTQYFVRAYVVAGASTVYGAEINFTTTLPIPLAPTNFVVTRTGVDEVTLTWTKGTYATNTVIRAKADGSPTSLTDGWEVYNGAAATATLTGFDLDSTVYGFSAWSWNATGYSTSFVTDEIGVSNMVYLVLGLLALGLTVTMFGTKNPMLGFPSAMFWAILGGYSYTQSATPWGDWQFYVFFASFFGMTIFSALSAYGLRERRESYIDEQGNERTRKKRDEPEREQERDYTPAVERNYTPAVERNTDDDILPPNATKPSRVGAAARKIVEANRKEALKERISRS